MSKAKLWRRTVGLAVAVPVLMPINDVFAADKTICYASKEFGTTRLVLDVKKHSDLTTTSTKQVVYGALGKHSYTEGYGPTYKEYMAVAHGAVVVSKTDYYNPYRETGAHLGLISEWVRAPGYGNPNPINWDCTSSEQSATPATWTCNVLVDGKVLTGNLYAVYRDPLCGAFQDGSAYPKP